LSSRAVVAFAFAFAIGKVWQAMCRQRDIPRFSDVLSKFNDDIHGLHKTFQDDNYTNTTIYHSFYEQKQRPAVSKSRVAPVSPKSPKQISAIKLMGPKPS